MSLLTAELRKVWGNRVFPMLLAVLVTANLLLLWMGTRPTSNQPPAAAYRAVGADLAALGSDMAAKGDLLHSKLDETESLLRLENYFRDSAYGNSVIQQNYREENAALFDQYEQMYRDKSYTLYTDSLTMEYRLLTQLVNEYDTVAGYTDFLESVQTKAGQLAGISIFQNDETGYDLKNIEVTAAVYADVGHGRNRLGVYFGRRTVCRLRIFYLPRHDARATAVGMVQIRTAVPQTAGVPLG